MSNCSTTTYWYPQDGTDGIAPARHGIAVEVTAKGDLVLRPTDALGAYFLEHFAHGDLHPTWSYGSQHVERGHPQSGLLSVALRSTKRPLLSSGGDPFYTGVSLSKDEQEACRALVDEMRAKPKKKAPAKSKKKGGAKS